MALYELEQRVFYDAAVSADVADAEDAQDSAPQDGEDAAPDPQQQPDGDDGENTSNQADTPAASEEDGEEDPYAEWIAENEEKIGEGGTAEDEYGNAVAIEGNIAVVAAKGENDGQGAVYVFKKVNGSWELVQKLTASDGEAGDGFGSSVAIDGDHIVVGASGDDDGGQDAGAAYVFQIDGGTWGEQAKITGGPDAAAGDHFGDDVDIDGGTIVVGAWGDDDYGEDSGAAYVFSLDGDSWYEQGKLTAGDGESGAEFGWSVAIDGDDIVVGAVGDGNGAGAAYVYTLAGATWLEQTKLTASDGESGDNFGWDVDIDGDDIIVGATGDDDQGVDSGAAYVFGNDGLSWSQEIKLTGSSASDAAHFGSSVALDGDVALVGAGGQSEGTGAAYVFKDVSGTWTEHAMIVARDGEPGDYFGSAVDVDSGNAVIGVPGDDDFGEDSGSAYIVKFERPPLPPEPPSPDDDGDPNINDDTDYGDDVDDDDDLDDDDDDSEEEEEQENNDDNAGPNPNNQPGGNGNNPGNSNAPNPNTNNDGGYDMGQVTPPGNSGTIVAEENNSVQFFDMETMDTSFQMPNGEYNANLDAQAPQDVLQDLANRNFSNRLAEEGGQPPDTDQVDYDVAIDEAEADSANVARDIVDEYIELGDGMGDDDDFDGDDGDEQDQDENLHEMDNMIDRLFLSDLALGLQLDAIAGEGGDVDGDAQPPPDGDAKHPAFMDALDKALEDLAQ